MDVLFLNNLFTKAIYNYFLQNYNLPLYRILDKYVLDKFQIFSDDLRDTFCISNKSIDPLKSFVTCHKPKNCSSGHLLMTELKNLLIHHKYRISTFYFNKFYTCLK